jgi:hypothetical protein
VSVTKEYVDWQQVGVLAANMACRMTADDPRDDEAVVRADDSSAEQYFFTDIETRTSERPDPAAEAPAETRDREESYHDLHAHHRAPGRSPDITSPGQVELGGDGRWTWKGLELDRHANLIADQHLALRRAAEGRDEAGGYGERGITPAMRRIEAGLEHGRLVPDTENFALKSPDRFKEKLAKLITLEPDVAPGDLAAKIHDGIRYTFLFADPYYSDGVRTVENRLAEEGYALVWRKPSWSGEEYKGINSQWFDPDSGVLFEVQFHTPASWDAKQRTHDSYEKIANPATNLEDRPRLRAYQREVSASVPVPPGALEFLPFKKEGR